ncbi:MAG: hypothetical protein IJ308_08880 [Clostridia bacterium]|nr:hypothetical protein [Clostridia bacterium]
MVDVEVKLFYQTVRAELQEDRAKYLKKQKREPFAQELTELPEKPENGSFFAVLCYYIKLWRARKKRKKELRAQRRPIMQDKIDKGYNAGMERAATILDCMFEKYCKKDERR